MSSIVIIHHRIDKFRNIIHWNGLGFNIAFLISQHFDLHDSAQYVEPQQPTCQTYGKTETFDQLPKTLAMKKA